MSINPDWFAEVTRIWLVIWLKAVNIKRELHYLCPLMFLFRMVRTLECSTCFSSSFLMSTSSVYKGQKTVTTINKRSRKAGNDINCNIWKTQLSKMVPFHPDAYTSKVSLINLTENARNFCFECRLRNSFNISADKSDLVTTNRLNAQDCKQILS